MERYKDTEYYITQDGKVFRNETERKTCLSNKGYKIVSFWKDGKQKKYNLHRIIAEIFVPNPNNKPCVNHIDGNKLNNNYNNLEWVSWKENMNHKIYVLQNGLGETHSQSKLPNKIVAYIKRCKDNKILPNYTRISNTYDVGIQHLKNIYKGTQRKTV